MSSRGLGDGQILDMYCGRGLGAVVEEKVMVGCIRAGFVGSRVVRLAARRMVELRNAVARAYLTLDVNGGTGRVGVHAKDEHRRTITNITRIQYSRQMGT